MTIIFSSHFYFFDGLNLNDFKHLFLRTWFCTIQKQNFCFSIFLVMKKLILQIFPKINDFFVVYYCFKRRKMRTKRVLQNRIKGGVLHFYCQLHFLFTSPKNSFDRLMSNAVSCDTVFNVGTKRSFAFSRNLFYVIIYL